MRFSILTNLLLKGFDRQLILSKIFLALISQKMAHNFFGTFWVISMRTMTATF